MQQTRLCSHPFPPALPKVPSRKIKTLLLIILCMLTAMYSYSYAVFFFSNYYMVTTVAASGTINTNSTTGSGTIWNHTLDIQSCASSILPGNWCLDTTHIPRYIGTSMEEGKKMHEQNSNPPHPPPMIQHYTHEGYDKCLGNKTIVF